MGLQTASLTQAQCAFCKLDQLAFNQPARVQGGLQVKKKRKYGAALG